MDFVSIAVKWIEPKLDSWLTKGIRIYKLYFMQTYDHFSEYRERLYKKCSIIHTFALNDSRRALTDIYVPQTLVNEDCSVKKGKYTKIDRYPEELIKKYKKILITDAAGMGKSTILKRMFIYLTDKKIDDIGIHFPIYIELNKLDKDNTILDVIQDDLSPDAKANPDLKKFDKDLLLKLIKKGSFVFFLDGYDEIPNAVRTEVTRGIRSFISAAGDKHHYILTSRPGLSFAGFDDFHVFKIQPLTKKEAFKLFYKYDTTKQKTVSKDLIKELDSGKYNSIVECLNNPMLVSLLFFVYNNKKKLKKHYFFDEIYNTYFKDHDNSKVLDPHEKLSDLDSYNFNRILRCVAYLCMTSGKSEFDERLILNAISYAKSNCSNSNFGESAYLNDLLLAVPFFQKNGIEYKWVHKPLMEYFTALFLAYEVTNYDKCLKEVCENAPFDMCVNMLDIYHEIDSKGFFTFVVRPLCERFISFYESRRSETEGINVEGGNINSRIGLLFNFEYAKLGIFNYALYKDERTIKELAKLRNLPDCYLSNMSLSKDAYLVARKNEDHLLLIRLYTIIPSFYVPQVQSKNFNYNIENLNNAFSRYEICGFCNVKNLNDVDEKTGGENEEAYIYINELLQKSMDFNQQIAPLDYQVCIDNIDNIKKIRIQNKKAIDDLMHEI